MTCALYEDQQMTRTFIIEGVTDENYYTALLGYPPTIIASDQVVKTFANNPIILKTSIKYHKEYDRDTEQEIMALLEENDNAKDFSWESKIEDADEIEKHRQYAASGNRDCVDSGFYRNHELHEHLCSKCAEPDDGAFGYGEYRDDPEADSWNAGQGRSSLCRRRMACYANSRNGNNVSSV